LEAPGTSGIPGTAAFLLLLCYNFCGYQTHFYFSIGVFLLEARDIPSMCIARGLFYCYTTKEPEKEPRS